MAQLIVRNLETEVKLRLQHRAARHGQSMEEEAREILRNALKDDGVSSGLGTEIAALFETIGLETEISELRGHAVKPAEFDR
jgi:plasmid stability protein